MRVRNKNLKQIVQYKNNLLMATKLKKMFDNKSIILIKVSQYFTLIKLNKVAQ